MKSVAGFWKVLSKNDSYSSSSYFIINEWVHMLMCLTVGGCCKYSMLVFTMNAIFLDALMHFWEFGIQLSVIIFKNSPNQTNFDGLSCLKQDLDFWLSKVILIWTYLSIFCESWCVIKFCNVNLFCGWLVA